jgi:predicted RNase H-like HicB family nuclease
MKDNQMIGLWRAVTPMNTPDTLHFTLSRYDDEAGVYYVIEGVEIALVTDADTIEHAVQNLREAVELYFEDKSDKMPLPRLELTLEVTEAYA